MSDLQIGLSAPDDLGRFNPDAQRAALAAIADAGIDHGLTADHISFIDDIVAFLEPFVEAGANTLSLKACGPGPETGVEVIAEVAARLRW